jgi:integrase
LVTRGRVDKAFGRFVRHMEEEKFIESQNRQRIYERAVARLRADSEVSDRNKELVLSFVRDATLGKTIVGRAKKKVGPARLFGYLTHLRHLMEFLRKDLDAVTQADMERFIEALEGGAIRSKGTRMVGREKPRISTEPISARYKVDIKYTVKLFYKWLWGDSRQYPRIVEWIDTFIQPKEIPALTHDEVKRMMDRASSPKHRALIQVLFDGGFRIGELLNVRLSHVWLRAVDPTNASDRCFAIRVPFSKTLRRTVILPMDESTRWLRLWLEDHPARPAVRDDGTLSATDLSAQLFPMTENAARMILGRVGRRALGKRVYPHLMRHTSATYWANKLPHFKLCKRFGWSMTSKMPQRYIDREGVDELDVARIYRESTTHKAARASDEETLRRMAA